MKIIPLCQTTEDACSFIGYLLFEYRFVQPEREQEREHYWTLYGRAYEKELNSPRFTVLEYRITEINKETGTMTCRPAMYTDSPDADGWDLRNLGGTPYKAMIADWRIERAPSLFHWHKQYCTLLASLKDTKAKLTEAREKLDGLKNEAENGWETDLRENHLYAKAKRGTAPKAQLDPIRKKWIVWYDTERAWWQREIDTLTAKRDEAQAALEMLPL